MPPCLRRRGSRTGSWSHPALKISALIKQTERVHSHLRLVLIDHCRIARIGELSQQLRRKSGDDNVQAKSPESETTTVPVCLSASRDVVMVVLLGGRRGEK